MVSEDESDEEEGHSEEDSDSGDEVDEVVDFLGDGCLASVQPRGQTGNTAHHSIVTTADNNALRGTCKVIPQLKKPFRI